MGDAELAGKNSNPPPPTTLVLPFYIFGTRRASSRSLSTRAAAAATPSVWGAVGCRGGLDLAIMAPVIEPPADPRRAVADRAGTLQGKLRALAECTLLLHLEQQQQLGACGRGGCLSSALEGREGREAAVARMQRRALEILIPLHHGDKRSDKRSGAPGMSAGERAESNALKLGSAALAMRRRGDVEAADLLEGLHDAFVERRTGFLPATPFTRAGPTPQPLPRDADTAVFASLANATAAGAGGPSAGRARHGFEYDAPPHAPYVEDAAVTIAEHPAALSLLLALAGTGAASRDPSEDAATLGDARRRSATDDTAVASSAFRHLSAARRSADHVEHPAAIDATARGRRADRASRSLRLVPAAVLEAPPVGFFCASSASGGGDDALRGPRTISRSSFTASFSRADPGLPFARSFAGGGEARLGPGLDAAMMGRGPFRFRGGDTTAVAPTRPDASSLFGALVRTRLPSSETRGTSGDVGTGLLSVRLTVPPWGEGGLLDARFLGGGDDDDGSDDAEDEPADERMDERASGRDEIRGPFRAAESAADAPLDAEPTVWLAALSADGVGASGSRLDRSDQPLRAVIGWDASPPRMPACGAFMSRGEAAFGRRYDLHLAPSAAVLQPGVARPIKVAVEDEVVHAARRALAGGKAAAAALSGGATGNVGGDASDLRMAAFRLPAAGAASTAAALGPIGEAAAHRAALEAFVRRCSAFGQSAGESTSEEDINPRPGPVLQAAAEAVRHILRAHQAALHALPAAVAARRDVEREQLSPLSAPYVVSRNSNGSNQASKEVPAVTLVEVIAHTRRLRAQLRTLHALCFGGGAKGNVERERGVERDRRRDHDGLAFLRRVLEGLSETDPADDIVRPLIRRLAVAASAPALAQLGDWLRCAAVDDPSGEFVVVASPGWGEAAAALEYAAPEAAALEWKARKSEKQSERQSEKRSEKRTRTRASPGALSETGDADDVSEMGEETGEGDGGSWSGWSEPRGTSMDATRVPPWEGGPPGRAPERRGCHGVGAEAAWLRDDGGSRGGAGGGAGVTAGVTGTATGHPLFAGLERVVLAAGVHLRVLQRLPQTAGFAARVSDALGDTNNDENAWRWALAFTPRALAEVSERRLRVVEALRDAARESLDAMAETRAAAATRLEARNRARLARMKAAAAAAAMREAALAAAAERRKRALGERRREEILERARARAVEKAEAIAEEKAAAAAAAEAEAAAEAAEREALMEATVERLASLAAQRERVQWQRRRLALTARRRRALEAREVEDEALAVEALANAMEAEAGGVGADVGIEPNDPTVRLTSSPREGPVEPRAASGLDAEPSAASGFEAARASPDDGRDPGPASPARAEEKVPGAAPEGSQRGADTDASDASDASVSAHVDDSGAKTPSKTMDVPVAGGDVSSGTVREAPSREETATKERGEDPETTKSVEARGDAVGGDGNRTSATSQEASIAVADPSSANPSSGGVVSENDVEENRVDVHVDSQTLKDAVEVDVPLPVALAACVRRPVLDLHGVMARLVVATMLDHLGVEAHAAAIGRYLLCGAGDFASALVEGLVASARAEAARSTAAGAVGLSPAVEKQRRRYRADGAPSSGASASARGVDDALHRALRESSAANDPLASRLRLAPRSPPSDSSVAFSEHSVGMVDFVEGEYVLEWPVRMLLPEEARWALAAAQRRLLKLRHASLALREAHDRVHEAGNVNVDGGRGSLRGSAGRALALRRLRRLSLLSSEFRHFVGAVEAHVGGRVHGAAARDLAARLRRPSTGEPRPADLYELRQALVDHAREVSEACLLSARNQPLVRAVDHTLQLALDFRAAMRRAPADQLLSDGALYAAVQTLHARFKITVRAVCRQLKDAAADTGGALGGVSPRDAVELLGQLDYNGFYLGEE